MIDEKFESRAPFFKYISYMRFHRWVLPRDYHSTDVYLIYETTQSEKSSLIALMVAFEVEVIFVLD